MADDHRRASGKCAMDWFDGVVLPVPAAAGRTRLELADPDHRRGAGLALAGTPDQCFLRAGADCLGAGLCRLRFQSLPEPAHGAGGLGY